MLALTGAGAGTADPARQDHGETAVAAARRAHIEMSPMLVGQLPHVASSISLHAPGTNNYPDVPVRVSVPENPLPGALVYLHGGGWVIGTLDTFDGVCRMLANHTRLTVVAVDYRLAPEHPYPAAIEDAESVLRWVASGGAGELAQSGPLVVAGDSAGGNLAASLCLRARDGSLPRISAQVLVYPITDATMSAESMQRFGTGLYLTADAMQWYWECYLQGSRAGAEHPASVLHEPLADLPPALVITAEFDPLRDEGEAFAARLEEAGNAVTLRRFDGMIHGFFRFTGIIDAAQEAADLVGEFLAMVLHQNQQENFLSRKTP
ncbi:alpha/beta hydrolase [Arthrobacter sp. I2-34]|uniref:Alpha/beta hydrolase n=1 Tax=Arthrobacter hankyongi TaxID=2904801 RepID=A0ABS9LCM9_9MICC|nr:alpha/beta hydrolase [Arthrobacter hankyongi]MCG2624420.1 alpha/beta hydrolase [Arthrobacter hankyongi]